jgi:glycolate oxidase iron-sulfur subunit
MQHSIEVDALGPQGHAMAHAVEKCVHCGFCLSACPTYKVLGEEMDSPRGRIFLMKETLEGHLETDQMLPYIDRCLGCMACVTACPSGVEYGELLTPFRARTEPERPRTAMERLTRLLVRETLPYPARFRAAALAGGLARPFAGILPKPLAAMLELLPTGLPRAKPLPIFVQAQGKRRARVAFLSGCVQQVLAPEINWATLRVLARNGVDVIIPPGQGCCGSLSMHIGEAEQARRLARKNLPLFLDGSTPAQTDLGGIDAIVTNAAGCGSGMREYGLLFAGAAEEDRAKSFANGVRDVSELLDDLGLVQPGAWPEAVIIAYHDACHLAHAQRITQAPRNLLASIENVTLTEVPEGELCCGSAGTYNLEQPELARQIGERKARNILSTGATMVAAGNIGCITQIQSHLQALDHPLPIYHTMEILDRAYRDLPFEA